MTEPQKTVLKSLEKTGLHPRNQHRGRYNFDLLIDACPELQGFVALNAYQDASIDFADPNAVKALNRALLKAHYAIDYWDIPAQFLCPPIPGRADYLHHMADLLGETGHTQVQKGPHIHALDIGCGANLIYPIIGQREYGWQFVGSDINPQAIVNAQKIIDANTGLGNAIELRLQTSSNAIFEGILKSDEHFDFTLCNPPFHASLKEAQAGTRRKLNNLKLNNLAKHGVNKKMQAAPALNFGGHAPELYCTGGEAAFVAQMINESKHYAAQCLWFSSLISKQENLAGVYRALKKIGANMVRTIDMAQGQKKSRIVAWTFLNTQQQSDWRKRYW